ncbi:hypothetical protein BDE02_18G112500 [Populus trichocarpa]|nr:hypothetical protein BDE02_18G112500 [Populus trichocarpa]
MGILCCCTSGQSNPALDTGPAPVVLAPVSIPDPDIAPTSPGHLFEVFRLTEDIINQSQATKQGARSCYKANTRNRTSKSNKKLFNYYKQTASKYMPTEIPATNRSEYTPHSFIPTFKPSRALLYFPTH